MFYELVVKFVLYKEIIEVRHIFTAKDNVAAVKYLNNMFDESAYNIWQARYMELIHIEQFMVVDEDGYSVDNAKKSTLATRQTYLFPEKHSTKTIVE